MGPEVRSGVATMAARIERKAGKNFGDLLGGGDRRSIGRVDEVVALLAREPSRIGEVVALLWGEDAVIRMRAADALEKISRERVGTLTPWKAELLGLMVETEQQEVRWHLALLVPRFQLDRAERSRVAETLKHYLLDRSSLVKTFALEGLWRLSSADGELRSEVVALMHEAVRTGTAAMRARARKRLSEHSSSRPSHGDC